MSRLTDQQFADLLHFIPLTYEGFPLGEMPAWMAGSPGPDGEWVHGYLGPDGGVLSLLDELIGLRDCFLSAKRVRDAFFGYGVAQLKRLTERGRFQGSLETRREKHARHVRRLLTQGYELYTTGTLPIRVVDPESYHEFGRTCAKDPEAKAAVALVTEYSQKFDAARTVLPEQPNEAPLEDFLQQVRRAHLDPA